MKAAKQAVAKKEVAVSTLSVAVVADAEEQAVQAIGKVAAGANLTNAQAAELFARVMHVRKRAAEGMVMRLMFAR